MDVILSAAGCTDKGLLRANNEDAFLCCPEHGVFAVCDGMGGAAAGEIASRMAIEGVAKRLCGENMGTQGSGDGLRAAVKQAISSANRKIHEQSRRDPDLQGMGTTIVLAVVSHGMAHVAHVGDSRCYLWRGGDIKQMTQDHSLVSEQVRLGKLSPAEAENAPYRNVITRALGTETSVLSDYQRFAVTRGDVLLLCSDGLTREMHDDEISRVVAQAATGEGLDVVCRTLINKANEAGGRDNITCVLAKI